jgi:hypothetical protein
LLLNPTLSDLVGGIESVTLSDEEARRRGTQKTVLERRSPPTFDVLIEIQERERLAIHTDVAEAVDALVRGYPIPPEIRFRDEFGVIRTEHPAPSQRFGQGAQGFRKQGFSRQGYNREPAARETYSRDESAFSPEAPSEVRPIPAPRQNLQSVRVYPYGVARNRLIQASRRLGVPVMVVDDAGEADVLLTLRSYYRKRQRPIIDAENRGTSIFVLRSNTLNQMQQFLTDLFNLEEDEPQSESRGSEPVMQETQAAIEAVLNGERYVELPPASAYIRRLQHQMARQANLTSHSYGKEPTRRVRIYRD